MTRMRVTSIPSDLRRGEVVFAFRVGDGHRIRREPARDPKTGMVSLRGVVEIEGTRMIAMGAVRVTDFTSGLLEVEEVSREVGQRAVSLLNSRARA